MFCEQQKKRSDAHNDVVDGDVDELRKESNETHNGKASRCGHADLHEFFKVRFGASPHQPDGVSDKLPAGLHKLQFHNLDHDDAVEVCLCVGVG